MELEVLRESVTQPFPKSGRFFYYFVRRCIAIQESF